MIAFVQGAAWWEYHRAGATMWQSDRKLAEEEAARRYPLKVSENEKEVGKEAGRS